MPASRYRKSSGKTMRSVTNLITSTITNLQNSGTVKRTVLVIPVFSSCGSLSSISAASTDSVSSCSLESSAMKIRGLTDLGFEKRFDRTVFLIDTEVGISHFRSNTWKEAHCTKRNAVSSKFRVDRPIFVMVK